MLVDSHCHLAGPEFAEDLDQVITRAQDAGVRRAFVILAADDQPELQQANAVSARWDDVRFSIGVHPHAAGKYASDPEEAAREVARAIDAQPLSRAIGEIGLDYHYDYSPRGVQHDVFRAQLRLARELQCPVVIHTREAEDDTIAILREEGADRGGGVLHCFSGTASLARAGLELGFYLSLAGIVTFPKARELRDIARGIPLDRLLVETDSPFLTPVPYRGQRNEPAHVAEVVRAVAELHGRAPAELAEQTRANFHSLFRP